MLINDQSNQRKGYDHPYCPNPWFGHVSYKPARPSIGRYLQMSCAGGDRVDSSQTKADNQSFSKGTSYVGKRPDGESHRPVPPWLPGQVKTLLLTYGPGAGD
jgi:hypothetical protein